jgi:hypothetical protein
MKTIRLLLAIAVIMVPASSAQTILQGTGSSYVSFEAESNVILIPGTPTSWAVRQEAGASGGAALIADGPNDVNSAPHSFAHYSIKFSQAGTYYVYSRWRADAARTVADQFTANSVWVPTLFGAYSTVGEAGRASLSTSAHNATQAPANNTYKWQREGEGNALAVTAADVSAVVPLIFSVGTREAGMLIDRWVMSTDPNLAEATLDALVNSQTDVVVQGSADSFVAFEAETKVKLIAGAPTSWIISNDPAASGLSAIYAGGPNDVNSAPHGFAQYQIKFTQPGEYNVYYRWKADPARTVADQFTANSVWIARSFGSFTTPGEAGREPFNNSASNGTQAPANNIYKWQREPEGNTYTVTQADVSGGQSLVFTVGTREAGMFIDRFVFHPSADLTEPQLDALPNSGSQPAGPEISGAVGSAALNTATLTFTRPLAAGSVAAGRFSISGGLAVTQARLDSADPRRVILTTAPQTQGTSYTITVNDVTDTSGTAIAANSAIAFTAWKKVAGWVTKEIYFEIPGGSVDVLLDAPKYLARTPDRLEWVKGFQLDRDPQGPNYAARLSAFYTPAAGGRHHFYVSNDDQAELFLSTGESEANLLSLGWFDLIPRGFDPVNSSISPFSLTAGQSYLLVGVLKQAGGDVYLHLAAKPESSAAPVASLPVLGGNLISTFVNPDLGQVAFEQQPQNVSATSNARARFAVQVQADQTPVYYQWQVDGQDIPGAIRPTYTTPVLSTADHGKKYRVIVSVAGRDTLSDEAVLSVTAGDPSHLQPYIGINFIGGGDSLPGPLSSGDVAGVVWQENWNSLPGTTFDLVPLVNAQGGESPVTLWTQPTEHWYSGTVGAGDADGYLLQGFVGTGASRDPFEIWLEGVPNDTYNVLIYSVGFPFNPAYEQAFSVTGAGSYPTYHVRAETGLIYNSNPGFRRMTSTNPAARETGNYIQFDNVQPTQNGSLVIQATWESEADGNGHQPAVNAIQLVRVLPVSARPSLSIAAGAGVNLTLSWPAEAAGFVLESSSSVGAGANWSVVTGTPNPIQNAGSVNAAAGTAAQFYRLRKSN